MTFYHGSPTGGLKELTPFISEHKEPYIYFATDPAVALLYSVHPVGKPFSWYPYGFDKNGTVVYSEYYPDALSDIYKEKTGYLYECDNVSDTQNSTNINSAYTCKKPVTVDRVTKINDVYTRFMEYKSQGFFHIKLFNEISAKEMQLVFDNLKQTIEQYKLFSKPECDMSRFIRNHFPDVWNSAETIFHYNSLIDEDNDPVHDPEPLRAYMDKWDGPTFMDQLQLSPEKAILEIGVGTGRLARKTAPLCGNFTGIDISPKTIKRAEENLAAYSNVNLICDDFMEHSFDRLFDVVYSSLTFMHIENKQAAISKIAGLLKIGGRFVLSIDTNQSEYIEMNNRKIGIFPDNPKDICGYIEAAGLVLEKQFKTEFAFVFTAKKIY